MYQIRNERTKTLMHARQIAATSPGFIECEDAVDDDALLFGEPVWMVWFLVAVNVIVNP